MTDILKRVRNNVYNTSGKYGVNVDMSGRNSSTDTESVTVATVEAFMDAGLSRTEATNCVMFASAHEGSHIKFSEASAIRNTMEKAQKENANLGVLNSLIQITEDYRIDYKTGVEFPGYSELRHRSSSGALKLFPQPTGNDLEDLFRAVSFKLHDVEKSAFPWSDKVDWENVEKVAKDLSEIALSTNTSTECLGKVYDYYKSTFHKNTEEEQEEENDTGESSNPEEQNGEEQEKIAVPSPNGRNPFEDMEKEEVDCAEDEDVEEDAENGGKSSELEQIIKQLEQAFNGDPEARSYSEEVDKNIEKSLNDIELHKESVENSVSSEIRSQTRIRDMFYPIWSEAEQERVEKLLCPDNTVHARAGIIYGIRKPEASSVLTSNEIPYSMFERECIPHAKQLANRLTQLLRAGKDDTGEIVSSGRKLIANRMWKPLHTSNTEVFYKPNFKEQGEYVIDLVLDASGSQGSRTFDIRQQAFIIARACSLSEIPCRVTQFRSHDTATMLELLRNYDDPIESDYNCNKMFSGGNNRDGLAIRIADIELQKRPEKNKIMLFLSDGSPADRSSISMYYGGVERYVPSPIVVQDVRNAVKDIRDSGTAFLAVYVGGRHGVYIEKALYGEDFAYIQDIKNMVPVLTKYLVKHIAGFDE